MKNHLWTIFAAWLVDQVWLVDALIAHCKKHPYFHIYEHGQLYMARFWLLKERSWLPFAIRLHEWHKPDDSRDLHDHPCDFRSIVLRGWYIEQDIYGSAYVRCQGDTIAHRRDYWHTIIQITARQVTYSLFIYSRDRQPWGFLVHGKKIPWEQYIKPGDHSPEYPEQKAD